MVYVNVMKTYRSVVAVCDEELLGKVFEERAGEFTKQIDVKENFYKGEQKTEDEAVEIMKHMAEEDATFNIVGEKSVACALKSEIITETSIGKTAGIPFALVLL